MYIEQQGPAMERTFLFDEDLPIGITFISDQHIGSEGTDHAAMREDAEIVRKTEGLYAILGGDGWDNHIKHLAAIINAKSAPTDQVKMFLYYISLFGNKIAAAISGNHEFWTKLVSGVDVVKMLMQANKIVYHPHELRLRMNVGSRDPQEYRICIRHKTRYNSSLNLNWTIKRLWQTGDFDFHIGFRGDEHAASIEPFRGHGLTRWSARGGSYQRISDYQEAKGYPRTEPVNPAFILYPNEFRIDAFEDMRKMVDTLKTVREAHKRALLKSKDSTK
jgi:hypothetical protein